MEHPLTSNIVERALISLLSPQPVATRPKDYRKSEITGRRRVRDGDIEKRVMVAETQRRPATMSVMERMSEHTATVFWSDPQSGHYAEQIWRRGYAQKDSFSALTGAPILQGDVIFRPRTSLSGVIPGNWDRMILESEVLPFRKASLGT
jgi:hypothetical protein